MSSAFLLIVYPSFSCFAILRTFGLAVISSIRCPHSLTSNFSYFSLSFLLSQSLILMVTSSVCVRSPSQRAKNTDRILQSVLPVTVILISRTGYPSGGSHRTVPPPFSRTCRHPHSSWSYYCTHRWLPACSLCIRSVFFRSHAISESVRIPLLLSDSSCEIITP